MKKTILFLLLAVILAVGFAQAEEYIDTWYQPEKEGAKKSPLEDYSDRVRLVCVHGFTFFHPHGADILRPFPSAEKQERCGGKGNK